jgi:hypothetical protein
MEFRQLRYLLTVAEHQGVRKAALSLRVNHPSQASLDCGSRTSALFGMLKSWTIASAPIAVAVAATAEETPLSTANLQDFAHLPFLILDPKYAPGYLQWIRTISSRPASNREEQSSVRIPKNLI